MNAHAASRSLFREQGLHEQPRRFAAVHEDSPKSSHGHFRLVPLICFGCLFIIILYYYYLFNLRCSRGTNYNQKTCLWSAFILM